MITSILDEDTLDEVSDFLKNIFNQCIAFLAWIRTLSLIPCDSVRGIITRNEVNRSNEKIIGRSALLIGPTTKTPSVSPFRTHKKRTN